MRPGSPAIVLAAVASHDQPCLVAHKIGKIAVSSCLDVRGGKHHPSQPSPIKGEGSWDFGR
jgi:hypothetical protein